MKQYDLYLDWLNWLALWTWKGGKFYLFFKSAKVIHHIFWRFFSIEWKMYMMLLHPKNVLKWFLFQFCEKFTPELSSVYIFHKIRKKNIWNIFFECRTKCNFFTKLEEVRKLECTFSTDLKQYEKIQRGAKLPIMQNYPFCFILHCAHYLLFPSLSLFHLQQG